MSKNLESYALQAEMREDLMACYREVAPTCLTQRGAWRKTINHPAKRYYVTPKQAAQIIGLYLHGRPEVIDNMKPKRKEMYYLLMDEMKKMMQDPENHKLSLREMMRRIVVKPAPQFFISEKYMRDIFHRMKTGCYTSDGIYISSPPKKKKEWKKKSLRPYLASNTD